MTEISPAMLVVDDEPGVVRLIERFASNLGFEVKTASSGREALEKLETENVAVALVDLRMPDVDGLDVLRGIRAAGAGCHVILMTGHASIDTAIEAIKLGAMDYLSKPFDFDRLRELLSQVRQDIDRRGAVLAAESRMAKQL
ncbi:MAG: response regulator, partial [Acidobacteria bacterium]|nr:response regulator [Acidobacteriota bacterium]